MYNSEYDILLAKLDEFIRKYYTNRLIRGVLYSTGAVLAFFLVIAVMEYFGHFDIVFRTALFYLFVITNGYVLTKLIVIPLLHLNKMGTTITNEQASDIIGKHFSNVQDKLLNVLQLRQLSELQSPNHQLVFASINQKIKEFKPIPFTSAIDLRQNKKYLKYALVPLLLFFAVLFGAPGIITESTERLIKHGTYFEKQAPFQFIIENKELKTPQQEDFLLAVKMDGKEIPEQIFVNLNGSEYKLAKEGKTTFSFLFKNVQKNISFQLSADGFSSKEYQLIALPKPILLDFSLDLSYPEYLEKKDETLHNTGDLVIPAGTKVSWNFSTQHTKQMRLSFADTAFFVSPSDENKFTATQIFLKDKTYSITTSNEFLQNRDSITYSVNVVPDAFPVIAVEEKKDSVSLRQFYYAGGIKDDYGFSALTFNYKFLVHNDSASPLPSSLFPLSSVPIPIAKGVSSQSFYHYWDMINLTISPGDEIEYYFEVWDNDGVNGHKPTRSQSMIYRAPTLSEINRNTEKNNSEIKEEMEESIKQAKELQKEMDDLYKKILEKKSLSWEEKKKLKEVLKQQKELEQKVNEIKKENQQNNQQQSEFQKPNDALAEKQQQLQKLIDQVMSEEMKKIMEDMQKMMDKMDKNKIQEMMEKMQLSNKDMEKELDRTLELFKKMEFEQKMEKTMEKLNELSKKQDDLGDKSLEKKSDSQEIKKEQDSLNKQFEDIQKDMQDMEKKNSELEEPQNMPDTKEKQEDIKKDMQNSSKELNEGKKKDASGKQKDASQKMNQMAQQMQEAMGEQESEQEAEDEHALRDILNNLIQLSFDQEALMKDVDKTKTDNPQYVKLSQQQKKLKDDSQMIEDSLLALSKRQVSIASTVNREIAAINSNMEKSISLMGKRENKFTPDISSRQQFSMTSINNLALMLNEALNQMQNNCKKSGSCSKPGSCKKPGHGEKPSSAKMKQMQQQLKKQMEALKKSMEQGKKEGGTQQGNSGWSQELVKIAAQQSALKQMMMEMQKEGGMKPGELENTLKLLEQSQKDVVNRTITEETINRQNQIMEKLLDFEKAEKERETEQKRQATQAKDDHKRNLSDFSEYNKRKEKETELLKTVPPSFKSFYKNKVSEYFNNFANEQK